MTWIFHTQTASALMLTLLAAWIDHRTGLIPNRLTAPALLLGLGMGLANGGGNGLLLSIAGSFATALVPLILFRFRAMGGGDVKLFSALGALLGAGSALETEIVAFFLGALQGLVVWYKSGQLAQGLLQAATLIFPAGLKRRILKTGERKPIATEIRFGPAIFAATATTAALRFWG